MRRMIFYKEWLKTRYVIAGAAAVLFAFTLYVLLSLHKTVQLRGGDMLWNLLYFKDTVLIEVLRYLPALCAVALAVFQYLPELNRGRIKLTLHLPVSQGRIIALMYCYALLVLTALFALQGLALIITLRQWLAYELVKRIILTALVWYLAGFAAYLLSAAVILEPTWKMRIVLILLGAGFIRLFYLSPVPEAYNKILIPLAGSVFLIPLLIFRAIARFKAGIQD